jgi:hypothetical protein
MELTFRDGEKSYKQFTQMVKTEKNNYISFLLSLDPETLSYNDKMILLNFGPTIKQPVKNLLSIND